MPYAHMISDIVSGLEFFIARGGYVLLFIFMFLEGVPLAGMLVPGHVAIIMAGFLVRVGSLNLGLVLIVSIVGAILGDFMGYYFGKKFGIKFLERFRSYFFISQSHIDKAYMMIEKHIGKALIIGRFTPATRSLMPFLVGSSNVGHDRFWLFNIIGGISWVALSVLLGYVFGTAYHLVSAYFGKIIIIAIILGFVIVWSYRFVNSQFHIFKKYEIFTLFLNIISLWVFALSIDKITSNTFKLSFDVWVNIFMDKLNHSYQWLVDIASTISFISSTKVVTVCGLLLATYLFYKRKWRSTAIAILSIGSTALVTLFLKNLFMVDRPFDALQIIINDPSFPSGPSSMAGAFFTVLAYLFVPKIKSWKKREIFLSVCVLMIIVIGLSRLILNVHWFTDVVAGWSLGIFLATLSILIVKYASIVFLRKAKI